MTPTTALSVLLAVALGAAPEKSPELYVQDYEVNVRATPAVKGTVAGKVRIGTACAKRAEAAAGWVEVRCGEVQGFVKEELLGPGKPELAPLLAKAGDASVPAKERLDAAMRAAYLAPEDEKALDLLRTSYFDAEFEGLRAERGGEAISREEEVTCELPTTRARCFKAALGSDYEFLDLELREGDFAVLLSAAGTMHVAKGTLGMKFEATPGLKAYRFLRYRVEARSHFPATDVLTKALQRGPNAQSRNERSRPLRIPDLESQKLTASIPDEWLLLSGRPGRRKVNCHRSFSFGMNVFGEIFFISRTGMWRHRTADKSRASARTAANISPRTHQSTTPPRTLSSLSGLPRKPRLPGSPESRTRQERNAPTFQWTSAISWPRQGTDQ